jgi:hypothetical protein
MVFRASPPRLADPRELVQHRKGRGLTWRGVSPSSDVVLAPVGNLAVPPSACFLCLSGSLRALATQRLGQVTLLGLMASASVFNRRPFGEGSGRRGESGERLDPSRPASRLPHSRVGSHLNTKGHKTNHPPFAPITGRRTAASLGGRGPRCPAHSISLSVAKSRQPSPGSQVPAAKSPAGLTPAPPGRCCESVTFGARIA